MSISARSIPSTTYGLLEELETEDVDWRSPKLERGARQSLTKRLAVHLASPSIANERIERVILALHVFSTRLRSAATVGLYGSDLARALCHAVFGSDLRLTLFANGPRSRRMLIFGETGTGKEAVAELLARTLLCLGTQDGPFLQLNAASLPDSLADAELFGHERGAFTGADTARKGLFGAVADGGVLFLDEIGEATPFVQSRLLRVVQSGEYRPVGSTSPQTAQFHIVAATNRTESAAERGSGLRADLYYRLARPSISLPPFRTLLVGDQARRIFHFLVQHVVIERLLGRSTHDDAMNWVGTWDKSLARELSERTAGYAWPGNLRECTGFIEQVVYQGRDRIQPLCEQLLAKQVPQPAQPFSADRTSLRLNLRDSLLHEERRQYAQAAGNAGSIDEVANLLGVARQTASRRLIHFGIKPSCASTGESATPDHSL